MKKYLFVLRQDEGCDYTIECGTAVFETDAENIVKAYKDLQENYGLDENMNYREEEIEIEVYEVDNYISKSELKQELEEFNDYLKLKNKFEEE